MNKEPIQALLNKTGFVARVCVCVRLFIFSLHIASQNLSITSFNTLRSLLMSRIRSSSLLLCSNLGSY